MESIFKVFQLGFILRSVFAGVFFVLSVDISINGLYSLIWIQSKEIIEVGLPVALFGGSVVYSIHRSLFYPLIEYIFDTRLVKTIRKEYPLISENTRETLLHRWDYGTKFDERDTHRAKCITLWADYAHLQYSSFLCIVFGAIVGLLIDPSNQTSPHALCMPLTSLAVILLLGGVVSDWRLRGVLDEIKKKEQTD